MTTEEFIVKFNLQKMLGFDIGDNNAARIAQVLGYSPDLVESYLIKFRQNNRKQAEHILGYADVLGSVDNKTQKTIAFIGDSITSDRESYFNIIRFVFKDFEGIRFIDAAVSGNRSSDTLLHLHERVIKHMPHIASIMIGTNDMQKTNDYGNVCVTSIVEYERNLHHIIERLKQAQVSIIINTLPPLDSINFDYSFGQQYRKYDDSEYEQYNDVVRKLSCEYKEDLCAKSRYKIG